MIKFIFLLYIYMDLNILKEEINVNYLLKKLTARELAVGQTPTEELSREQLIDDNIFLKNTVDYLYYESEKREKKLIDLIEKLIQSHYTSCISTLLISQTEGTITHDNIQEYKELLILEELYYKRYNTDIKYSGWFNQRSIVLKKISNYIDKLLNPQKPSIFSRIFK